MNYTLHARVLSCQSGKRKVDGKPFHIATLLLEDGTVGKVFVPEPVTSSESFDDIRFRISADREMFLKLQID